MCREIDDYTNDEIIDHLNHRKITIWFLKTLAEKRKFSKEIIDALIREDKLESHALKQQDLENWKAGKAKVV